MAVPTLPRPAPERAHPAGRLGPVTTVVDGVTFPSGVAFDQDGVAYLAETGLRPEGPPKPGRVWRVDAVGGRTLLAGDFIAPITGLVFHDGALWVSQGGPPGQISRLGLDGTVEHVLTDLPGGDHQTGEVAFGPDGKLYWGQGSLTNTGIVGLDTVDNGWRHQRPAALDVPGYDIVLRDVRVQTRDPFADEPDALALTGPFSPFGDVVQSETHILGARLFGWPLATASVHRANPDGSQVELVCWGVRNPFGLRFLPDGRLLAIDQGAADRGSRPVGQVPDYLWQIRDGAWYGWPDYFGGRPVTDPRFAPGDGSEPDFLLANHHELPRPERPLVEFTGGIAATAFDVDPASDGQVIAVALCGEPTGATSSAVVLVHTTDWSQHVFSTNALSNPVDLRYHPTDGSLWIVDFGELGPAPDVRNPLAAGRRRGRVLRIAHPPRLLGR